jgi:phosphohistidine phosphatase
MKTLYLLRHAKSSWDDPELDDFDRPLNKRGKRDAPAMGGRLRRRGVRPDLLLSSPARRALSTARTVAREIGYERSEIATDERLYLASPGLLLEIVREQRENLGSVMLFGHNPGFTRLAELLTGERIENVPTCGFVEIALVGSGWPAADPESGRLVHFDFPKNPAG